MTNDNRQLRIGVCGPANPSEFKDYLNSETDVPNINCNAAAVNAHIESLLKLGQEVYVFTKRYKSDLPTEIIEGKQLHFIIISEPNSRLEDILRFKFILRLKKILHSYVDRLDILHAQWTYEYTFAILPYVNKVPSFCTVRDWCPYLSKLQKRIMGRLIWKVNYFMFRKIITNKNITFIANSEYTYNCLYNYDKNLEIAKIANGIKSQFILEKRDVYPTTPTFVSIAQDLSEKRKNIISLLKAFQLFKQNRDGKLILIGSYKNEERNHLEDLGLLKDVILTGSMSHDNVVNTLDRCSALVHPSVEETFGNILLEGMARRIPVIGGQDAGGVPMVLGHGKYGILCNEHSPKSIEEAMVQTTETGSMITLINSATRYIKSNYSSDTIGEKHMSLYYSKLK